MYHAHEKGIGLIAVALLSLVPLASASLGALALATLAPCFDVRPALLLVDRLHFAGAKRMVALSMCSCKHVLRVVTSVATSLN